jgi:cell division protein FtsW (lipid II flippase)
MWVVLLIIIFALVVWIALGTEAGIAGVLQPSEIVKTLTVFILAATITLALEPDRGPGRRSAGLSPVRNGGWLSFCAATIWAARLYLCLLIAAVGLRSILPENGTFAAVLELIALAALLAAIVVWLRSLRNYLWRAFLMIVVLLAAILVVPVVRNDLSPFVVLGATSVVTFLFVVVIHWLAIINEWLQLSRPQRAPPPDTSRRRVRTGTALRGLGLGLWIPLRRIIGRILARPEPWMLAVVTIAVVIVWVVGSSALANAEATRKSLLAYVGGSLDKPVERLISWIEFNGKAPAGKVIGVEFADVGLQVARSRDVIAISDCDGLDRRSTQDEIKHPLPPLLTAAAQLLSRVAGPLDKAATRMIHSDFLPTQCAGNEVSADAASKLAIQMPEIQNDFVSTWLIAIFGRDGAVGIMMLQCLLLAAMLFAGFLTIKWTPGHLLNRPAASVAGYATIGFAVMLGVQWTISWLNALGALPVMGQPSTFLSHGPSHALLFGAPAVLTAICALRLRSAFLTRRPDARPDVKWRFVTLKRT